jgi:hypothetical protein
MLLVIAAWPVAQIYPTPMLFGNGDLQSSLAPVVEALGGRWVTFADSAFGPAEYVLAEAFVVAAAVIAVGCALASVLRPAAPGYGLLIGLLATALATRSFAHAVQFGPERALAWLTPGAWSGFALGALSLAVASAGPNRRTRALSVLATLLLLAAVNLVPDNPYHLVTMQEWRQGQLLNFNALAHWVSVAWPIALLLALLFHRSSPRDGPDHRSPFL